MRHLTVLSLLLLPAAAFGQVAEQSITVPSVVAAGEGKLALPPDQVTVLLAVQTQARTPVAASGQNAERMTTLLAALRSIGLDSSEISTAHYSVHAQTYRTERDTVFVATNAARIETKKLSLQARIIDEGLRAGATSISSVQFGLSDRSGALREAMALAVADARLKAEAMAAAAGGRLGPLIEMSAQPAGFPPLFAATNVAISGAAQVDTPINPGDVSVVALVTARWRFLPDR